MSGFQMVGTIAIAITKDQLFENQTIWNPTFQKSSFQMFLDVEWSSISDPHCTPRLFGVPPIQDPILIGEPLAKMFAITFLNF